MKRFRSLFWLILTLLATAGCVTMHDPESSQVFRAEIVGTAGPEQPLGQTFVSRRPGLNGVELWLSIGEEAANSGGLLEAALFHAPEDPLPVAWRSLPLSQIVRESPVHLSFPTQNDPPEQSYYLEIKTTAGEVLALGRNEEAYAAGRVFLEGQAAEADLGFRLTYEYGPAAVLADLRGGLESLPLAVHLLLCLWLPGRVALAALKLDRGRDWGERWALSTGLSLAMIPVLMLWTTWMGLGWSRWGVWAAALALAVLLAVMVWRRRGAAPEPVEPVAAKQPGGLWAATALAVVFGLTLAVRLIMVRDLSAPAWVDSVHHAILVRLIVEGGGFPQSYAPYLDVTTASYHTGFHSLVAVFHWLSGVEIPTALLLLGQVLNALAVPAVYLLAVALTKDPAAGVVAGLVAGLCTPMPAYYTSWGRYTQLAGLLILPTAFAFLQQAVTQRRARTNPAASVAVPVAAPAAVVVPVLAGERVAAGGTGLPDEPLPDPEPLNVDPPAVETPTPIEAESRSWHTDWPSVAAAGLAIGGLALVHYRVGVFLLCLLAAFLLVHTVERLWKRDFWPWLAVDIGLMAAAGLAAIVLTLPWWPDTLRTLLIPKLSWTGSTEAFSDFSWSYLDTALGKYVLVLAPVGLVWGLLRRRSFPMVLMGWVGLLFLVANLGALGLPASGLINNISVTISLFMPLAVACGYLGGWLVQGWKAVLPARLRPVYSAGLAVAGLLLALAGVRLLLPLLRPDTMLFREADRPAMEWITNNIPPEETILINATVWGYGIDAGSDGGYWITPMTGHRTIPPPVLYSLNNSLEKITAITEISRTSTQMARKPEELHAYLQETGIRYLYLGARGGPLSAKVLRSSALFEERFAVEGTYVFEVR